MTVVNFNYPKFKYTIASTGQPGAGYKLFTYVEGTSTKKTTWTSLAKTATNTNPIILDANGEADVWIDGDYKFVLAPPTDTDPPTSPVWTYDAIRSEDTTPVSTSTNISYPINGSFEVDTDSDGVPDNWSVVELTGGSVTIDNTSSTHGTNSLKFTSVGSGGGEASTDDYYEVEAGKVVGVRFSIISADVNTLNKVQIYWYDSSKVYLSASVVYNEGAANPTTWTRKYLTATAPAAAKFAKVILTGVDAASSVHSSTNFENIELDTGFTGEITASVSEINTMDGITASATELNTMDGITASTTELNYLVGTTSSVQTQINSKANIGDESLGWELLESWTPTAVNSKDFTWDESLYGTVKVVIDGVSPATDDSSLRMRIGYSDGGTIITSSSYSNAIASIGVGLNARALTTTDHFYITEPTTGVGTDANEGASAVIELIGPGSTKNAPGCKIVSQHRSFNVTDYCMDSFALCIDAAARTNAIDTVRLYWEIGNYDASGNIAIYGMRRA